MTENCPPTVVEKIPFFQVFANIQYCFEATAVLFYRAIAFSGSDVHVLKFCQVCRIIHVIKEAYRVLA
jgi:hypothetical protein